MFGFMKVWLYEGLALLMVWLYQLSGAFARDGAVSENSLTPQDRSPDSTFELTAYIRAQLVTLKQICHFESICLIEIDQAQIRIGRIASMPLRFRLNRRAGVSAITRGIIESGTPRSSEPWSKTASVDCIPAIPPHMVKMSVPVFMCGGAGRMVRRDDVDIAGCEMIPQ